MSHDVTMSLHCVLLGEGPQSVGVFSCSEGYYLEGKQTVECNVFGEWESDLPVCRGEQLNIIIMNQTLIWNQ